MLDIWRGPMAQPPVPLSDCVRCILC